MFGEIILISGISLVAGLTSKVLEDSGKEKIAKKLDICYHVGMGAYAIRLLNKMFDEISDFL